MTSTLEFRTVAKPWLYNEKIEQMRNLEHHRGTTIYDHVCHVAQKSYNFAKHCPFHVDTDSVLTIAFLHDYFLYDRKIPKSRLYHSYRHPVIAAENASRDFNIGKKEYLGILTHMWPQVPWLFPRSREAWIVCFADKVCAVQEYARRGCARKRKVQKKPHK